MLFKHKHLLEDLRRHGRKARAEILSMTTIGEGNSARAMWAPDDDLTTSWTDCRMRLRVVPEDRAEAPFEADVLTRIHTTKFKGTHVPVWYDPQNHSRVVVDYEEDAQNTMRALAVADDGSGERSVHRYDQQLALAWTPVGEYLLPLEVICRPGSGRLDERDPLGAAARDAGRSALERVRGSAESLLPALPADWFDRHDLFLLPAFGGLPQGLADAAADWPGTAAAIAAAIVSLLDGHMVRTDVALTGRLGPGGELLPVNGFAASVDTAVKGYARRFVVPEGNESEARAIPERRRKDLEFVYASTLEEALRASLARHQVKGFIPPA
jgi:ATP-dependent Lon protease